MDDLNDTQIRADLRSLFAESGVDPNRTSFLCASGIVRVLGELRSARRDVPIRPSQVDGLEQSVRRTRGVKRVHFNLKNWERLPNGEWKPIGPKPGSERKKTGTTHAEQDEASADD